MISKKYSLGVFLLLLFASPHIWIVVTGKTFIYKAIYYNLVNIDDYKIFKNRTISKSDDPFHWPISKRKSLVKLSDTLTQTLEAHQTVSFLLIKQDSIYFENYWRGYDSASLSNAFSMSKTVVALLVGIALRKGYIQSVDQSLADFLPEFNTPTKRNITIRHCLMMASGLQWEESSSYSNPLKVIGSDILEAYYGNNLYTHCTKSNTAYAPGTRFDYSSQDTQILSFVLAKATGMSVSAFCEQMLWKPMGAATHALWCLDEYDHEKAFCCLNSNAREFAKLGLLVKNYGYVNGNQILDSGFVQNMCKPIKLPAHDDSNEIPVTYYGWQIWMMNDLGYPVIYFRGTLGQLIMIFPDLDVILVHLGESQGSKTGPHYTQSVIYAREVYKMFSR